MSRVKRSQVGVDAVIQNEFGILLIIPKLYSFLYIEFQDYYTKMIIVKFNLKLCQ